MMDAKVDVIIPVYKPQDDFVKLIVRLARQTVEVGRIIIMNTDEEAWDKSHIEDKLEHSQVIEHCEIHHVSKEEFNHGTTRNIGVGFSDADYFVCMTQDALPKDDRLIEQLILPMQTSEEIKMTYARQLPKSDSGYIEKFTRLYNYPAESLVKSEADKDTLGIKLYFASNVCAAYDRDTFDKLGHFPDHVILNEDMIYASKLIKAGYKIAYSAQAKVFHAHEYTGMQQFRRNYDIAASQIMWPDVFGEFKSESEGIRMVKRSAAYLIKEGKSYMIVKLVYISACKYLGYKAGRYYKRWPKGICRWMSMNKDFWEKTDD